MVGSQGWGQQVGVDEVDVYQNIIEYSNSFGAPRSDRYDGAIAVCGFDGYTATRVHIRDNRITAPNVTTAAINIYGLTLGYTWWIDVTGNVMWDAYIPLMFVGGNAFSVYKNQNYAPWLYRVQQPMTWR